MRGRQPFRIAVIAAVTASMLVAAGCGDADDTSTTATTDPVPVDSTTSTAGNGAVDVSVFFTPDSGGPDCNETVQVDRTVQGSDVLAETLRALLAGPTAEERDAGTRSWFSDDTADALLSATVVDGTARVDLADISTLIGGASSSCGSAQLMSQLDRTAEQFPNVERTLYSFEGDVEAFYGWLQGSPPDYFTPAPSTSAP